MRHGSLFSGIGGFDLAAQWMGWENVFHCEWNEFGKRVLSYYWPNAISYHDITKTDFTIYRGGIDILTGGFPCQPYSMAGKRKGKDDERHLWPEMLRAIREIQPRWVVGENVLGLVNWDGGLVFDEVQADLESQGYEVQPYVLPACAVNAPHRRDRVWFVAKNTMRSGWTHREAEQERTTVRQFGDISTGSANRVCLPEGATPDPNHDGHASTENGQGVGKRDDGNKAGAFDAFQLEGRSFSDGVVTDAASLEDNWDGQGRFFPFAAGIDEQGAAPDADSNGQHRGNGKYEKHPSQRGFDAQRNIESGNDNGATPDAEGEQGKRLRLEQRELSNAQQGEFRGNGGEVGNGATANAHESGRTKQHGAGEPGRTGHAARHSGGNWHDFPTQSPVCSRNDGFSSQLDGITFPKWRNESIKAAGNAIVPQVAYQIFKAIEAYEQR